MSLCPPRSLALLLVMLCSIMSCQSVQLPSNELRLSISTEPPTLDPNLATDTVSFLLLNQLQEGLTEYDDKLNILPAGALRWNLSSDGRTYHFHLNPNAKWSDGKPVLAQHFVDSWLRLLNPTTGAPYAYFLYPIAGAEDYNHGIIKDPQRVGVHALSDFELEVTLTKPTPYFTQITTFMVTFPIRTDLMQSSSQLFGSSSTYVGNGAYTLDNWQHDDRITLKKNIFFGGSSKPTIETIKIFIIPESITAVALYQRGDLDYVALPPMAIPLYHAHPEHMRVNKLRGTYFGFNVTIPPFDRPEWRQALAMSLDKSKLPKILMGEELPTNSWIPFGMFGADQNLGLKFDPQKAKQLINAQQGKMPPLELHFNFDTVNKRIAEWAQQEWKQNLGLEVSLVNEEWKSYLAHLNTNPPALFRMGWGADYPDPDNFMNLFTAESGNNHTRWKNPEYDHIINQAASTLDPDARFELYQSAQRILLEKDAVIIPLFVSNSHYLVNRRVKNLDINALDVIYFRKVKLTAPELPDT